MKLRRRDLPFLALLGVLAGFLNGLLGAGGGVGGGGGIVTAQYFGAGDDDNRQLHYGSRHTEGTSDR